MADKIDISLADIIMKNKFAKKGEAKGARLNKGAGAKGVAAIGCRWRQLRQS